tara:strand:- start:287 stop:1105 length:819 start_codon:yes stop_codon:yes gene_type:complete
MKILSTQLILLLFIFLNLPVAFGGFISNCSTCGGPSVKENKLKTKKDNENPIIKKLDTQPIITKNESKWLNHIIRKKIKNKINKPNFSIIMAKKPCPTNFRWFHASNFSSYLNSSYNNWRNSMEKRLSGYPQETIETCTKLNYLIYKQKTTNHKNNQENLTRSAATMVWRKNDIEAKAFRIIVESNYRTERTGGAIYNKNLKKICTTKTIDKNNGIIDCVGLKPIKYIFTVIDESKGIYKAFGRDGNFFIFLTNKLFKDAKNSFPEIFNNVK